MNPWHEVVERIEDRDDEGLAGFLASLGELGRRAVAVQLPGHLAERLFGEVDDRWRVMEQAAGSGTGGKSCPAGRWRPGW
ncbi:hypothetical protein [Planomonospora algeriensis]